MKDMKDMKIFFCAFLHVLHVLHGLNGAWKINDLADVIYEHLTPLCGREKGNNMMVLFNVG